VKESVDGHKRLADVLVYKMKKEAKAKVNQITEEWCDIIAKAEEEALAAQEAAKSEANNKVGKSERDTKNQVHQIKVQLEALKQTSAVQIKVTTKESNGLVETAKNKTSARTEAMIKSTK